MLKILVGDNYPLSKIGIVSALSNEFGNIKIIEASNEKEMLGFLKLHHFDLAILALSQPGNTSAEILKRLHLKFKELPILVICIYPESLLALRAIKMGASGYLTRESPISELTAAVKKIVSGGIFISGNMLDKIISNYKKENRAFSKIELLSDRELQVLQLLASGRTTKFIASEVNLSMSTISTYKSRILNKLGLKTNSELTRFAIENLLV